MIFAKKLDRVSWISIAIGVCVMLVGALYRTLQSPVLDMRVAKGVSPISTWIIVTGAAIAICIPAGVIVIQVLRRISSEQRH